MVKEKLFEIEGFEWSFDPAIIELHVVDKKTNRETRVKYLDLLDKVLDIYKAKLKQVM